VVIAIARDQKQRKLSISHPEYISQIMKKFHMALWSPKSIPAYPNVHLVKPTGKKEEENAFSYREAVGALLYLALLSRPDISFAVGQLARFVDCYNLPTQHRCLPDSSLEILLYSLVFPINYVISSCNLLFSRLKGALYLPQSLSYSLQEIPGTSSTQRMCA
jgi:hypothetical protein